MKTLEKLSKEATNKAWKLVMDFRNLRFGKMGKLDKRYILNKEALKIAKSLDYDSTYILQKKKERQERKYRKNNNILSNPIVVDYLKHKDSICFINDERINFGQRNHWAKNEKDIKILTILRKRHTKI